MICAIRSDVSPFFVFHRPTNRIVRKIFLQNDQIKMTRIATKKYSNKVPGKLKDNLQVSLLYV